MPLSIPQEFLNRICTCSKPLRRCSIRFLDDWWTRFIGSQLLYSLRANWITLWCNWLLCYGMHHGKLSNPPAARLPLPNWDQISYYYSDEKFDDCVIITGNDCILHYASLFWDWKHHNQDYIKSRFWIQDDTTRQSGILAQETKRERFPNIMINNSSHKWNYSSMCSFLVNWILEENHSRNCYIFGSRVIMIGFRVIMIFIVFISPWCNWVLLNAAGCSFFVIGDELCEEWMD